MELTRLIDALTDPAAYPERVEKVEVRQTHISAVFLVGRYSHAGRVQRLASRGEEAPTYKHRGGEPLSAPRPYSCSSPIVSLSSNTY